MHLRLDTDRDVGTGCAGVEVHVVLNVGRARPAQSFVADMRDCGGGDDFPGALQATAAGRFLEAAVALTALNSVTPDVAGFRVDVSADVNTTIAEYVLR